MSRNLQAILVSSAMLLLAACSPPDSTPDRAVRAFCDAVNEGRFADAGALLDPPLAQVMMQPLAGGSHTLLQVASDQMTRGRTLRGIDIRLAESDGPAAIVDVRFRFPNSATTGGRFALVLDATGRWKLASLPQ